MYCALRASLAFVLLYYNSAAEDVFPVGAGVDDGALSGGDAFDGCLELDAYVVVLMIDVGEGGSAFVADFYHYLHSVDEIGNFHHIDVLNDA